MSPDLLEPLEIFAQFGFHAVGQHLRVFAVNDIALSVEEPGRDLVLGGVLDDGDDALEFFGCDFAGSVDLKTVSITLSQFRKLRLLCASLTSCSDQHQPSCKPNSSSDGQHP
jgi:hypothetical protein